MKAHLDNTRDLPVYVVGAAGIWRDRIAERRHEAFRIQRARIRRHMVKLARLVVADPKTVN